MKQDPLSQNTQNLQNIPDSEYKVKLEKPDSLVKLSPWKNVRFGESPNIEYSNFKSPNIDHIYNQLVQGQKLNFYAESPNNTLSLSQNNFFKNQGFYNNYSVSNVKSFEEVKKIY